MELDADGMKPVINRIKRAQGQLAGVLRLRQAQTELAHAQVGLVQALGVTAAFHNAAGELVDDLDLAVGDHVLLVAVEHVLGLQRLLQVVDQLAGEIGIDVIDTQAALDLLKAALGGGDGVLGLVHDVVARGFNVLGGGEHVVRHVLAALKATHGTREVLVGAGGLGAGARDDERRSGLVD